MRARTAPIASWSSSSAASAAACTTLTISGSAPPRAGSQGMRVSIGGTHGAMHKFYRIGGRKCHAGVCRAPTNVEVLPFLTVLLFLYREMALAGSTRQGG